MKLKIAAIGRIKIGPEQQLLHHYVDRSVKAGRGLHLFGPEIVEFSESKKGSAEQRKADEADMLISTLPSGAILIALDENGKSLSSEGFAALIADNRDNGCTDLVFAIGGPDGHGPELLSRAKTKIALGSLTWPHQIARVLLCEQIYRACTILSGHPYHRS